MLITAPFESLVDLIDVQIPADTPHPVLHCRCGEGRVVTEYRTGAARVVRHWLPPVHDCLYIRVRNRRLGLGLEP